MLDKVRLGTFTLSEPIGLGGMGQVWAARHRASGVPVAVKVVQPHLAQSHRAQEAFRAEVRAMARLDHPGIAWVFDLGTVDEAASTASDGTLVVGSPWVAMEYAERGTLLESDSEDWDSVRKVIEVLLDALAHAHARGLVHRDLKPSNVLLCGHEDVRPGPKLADFGLAQTLDDDTAERPSSGGTVPYMSPEQLVRADHQLGPWTDLYGLGCVVWELLTGAPPFGWDSWSVARAHLADPLPALRARFEIPDELEGWLRWLLRKDPLARPRTAALAASTLPYARTRCSGWRPAVRSGKRSLLQGAGLEMVGLREAPFAGRISERDQLWTSLERVRATGSAHCAVIRGPAGSGKTRLARWLGRRAEELGHAVTALEARHGPDGSGGLAGGLRRALRLRSLPTAELRQWVESRLGLQSRTDEIVAALTSDRLPVDQRRPHLIEALRRLGMPAVLILDDVQWSSDSIATALNVLDTRQALPAPLLILLTAQDEALAEHPNNAKLLEELCHRPGAAEVRLPPLDRAAVLALIEGVLPLEPATAATVADRAAGSPLFAHQLLTHFAQQGALVDSPRGYVVDAPDRPMQLDVIWSARVERVLRGLPIGAGPWLERAAVCGPTVDLEEWLTWANELGGMGPEQCSTLLIERLVHAGLARIVAQGWEFSHGLVATTLLERASAAGRLEGHHRAAADRFDPGTASVSLRRGRHLFAAGCHEEAADHLLRHLRDLRYSVGYRAALQATALVQRSLSAAGIPNEDPRWAELICQQVYVAEALRAEEVMDDMERFEGLLSEGVRQYGWPRSLLAEAGLVVAGAMLERERFAGVEERLQEAEEHCEERLRAWVGMVAGCFRFSLALGRDDVPAARKHLARTHEMAAQWNTHISLWNALSLEALLAAHLGQLSVVTRVADQMLEVATSHKAQLAIARSQIVRATCHLLEGEHEVAETMAREAEQGFIATGHPERVEALAVRAHAAIARSRAAEALGLVREALPLRPVWPQSFEVVRLVAEVEMGDLVDIDARVVDLGSSLKRRVQRVALDGRALLGLSTKLAEMQRHALADLVAGLAYQQRPEVVGDRGSP